MNLLPDQNNQILPADSTRGASSSGGVAASPPPPAPPPPPPASAAQSSSGGFGGGLTISLMPSGEGEDGGSLRRWLIILLAAILVETVAIGGGYLFMINREVTLKERLVELEQSIQAGTTEIDEAESDAIEASQFGTRARMVGELLDAHLRWTRFFQHLSSRTKASVRYLNFAGDVTTRTVSMDAIGESYRDVAEQIVALREDEAVIGVITTSASARANERGEIEGVGFSLVITLEDYMWSSVSEKESE